MLKILFLRAVILWKYGVLQIHQIHPCHKASAGSDGNWKMQATGEKKEQPSFTLAICKGDRKQNNNQHRNKKKNLYKYHISESAAALTSQSL